MAESESAGFTAKQSLGLLQIHGDIGSALLDGMDDEQRAAIARLHAELFLTAAEAAEKAAEADQAAGNGSQKPSASRKRRASVLAPRP